jgi:hypothetical protein
MTCTRSALEPSDARAARAGRSIADRSTVAEPRRHAGIVAHDRAAAAGARRCAARTAGEPHGAAVAGHRERRRIAERKKGPTRQQRQACASAHKRRERADGRAEHHSRHKQTHTNIQTNAMWARQAAKLIMRPLEPSASGARSVPCDTHVSTRTTPRAIRAARARAAGCAVRRTQHETQDAVLRRAWVCTDGARCAFASRDAQPC